MNPRVAVVTGGTKGLGAAIGERLIRDGFRVAVVHRDPKAQGARTNAGGSERGGDPGRCENGYLEHLHGDVTEERDVKRIVQEATGLGEVYAWINAVGDFEDQLIGRATVDVWERMLRSNLMSAMLCCREIIPVMRRHGGAIVNLAVARAGIARSAPHALPYVIAKEGVVALTLTLAKTEGANNIRVNVVNPGFIAGGEHSPAEAVGKIPLARLGTAEDVANAVSFLVSNEASYITGAVLAVDGGVFL